MTGAPVLKAIDKVQGFMKANGGSARDWHVGISGDARRRLGELKIGAPYAEIFEQDDESSARAILAYFLRAGSQLDRDGGGSQFYAYRLPRFPTFREFLKKKANDEAGPDRARRREEWLASVKALLTQVRDWLKESDPDGLLDVRTTVYERVEQELGVYAVEGLRIRLGEAMADVVPVGGNVAGPVITREGSAMAVRGRVDVTNGAEKYVLYRVGDDRTLWQVVDQDGRSSPLTQQQFEVILQDLLA
jgi:hypothetical protein